jgi:hypothetical protein
VVAQTFLPTSADVKLQSLFGQVTVVVLVEVASVTYLVSAKTVVQFAAPLQLGDTYQALLFNAAEVPTVPEVAVPPLNCHGPFWAKTAGAMKSKRLESIVRFKEGHRLRCTTRYARHSGLGRYTYRPAARKIGPSIRRYGSIADIDRHCAGIGDKQASSLLAGGNQDGGRTGTTDLASVESNHLGFGFSGEGVVEKD